jgi:aryl-alcohol dehydrogenase-like predicted oxidoreductase
MGTGKRRIGSLEVSLEGLGCNNFGRRLDAAGARSVVEAALEAGITHFDTADVYGVSETFLGQALGARRDDVVVTTKFAMGEMAEGPSGGDARWVGRACEQSLRRLGCQSIDLFLLLWPDGPVPIIDTLAAMNRLIDEGKVREIGCSNFSAAQLAEAHAAARDCGLRGFACVQNEYNLLQRTPQAEVLATCAALKLAFVPFLPLAMGLLKGRYRQGRPVPSNVCLPAAYDSTDEAFVGEWLAKVEQLALFAERHGHSLLELALSWLACNDQIASVIAGAMTAAQVRENVAATTAWKLDAAELAEVDRLTADA